MQRYIIFMPDVYARPPLLAWSMAAARRDSVGSQCEIVLRSGLAVFGMRFAELGLVLLAKQTQAPKKILSPYLAANKSI